MEKSVDASLLPNEIWGVIILQECRWMIAIKNQYQKLIDLSTLSSRFTQIIYKEVYPNIKRITSVVSRHMPLNVFEHCLGLQSLSLFLNDRLTDTMITKFTHLHTLYLRENVIVTNDVLRKLPLLRRLNLSSNKTITDEGIKDLLLVKLGLSFNTTITDKGIAQLPFLSHLILFCDEMITDEGLLALPSLRKLRLAGNERITDECIKTLTLESFDIC